MNYREDSFPFDSEVLVFLQKQIGNHTTALDPYGTLVAALCAQGSLASGDAQTATGLNAGAVRPLLQRLVSEGVAEVEGQKRGTRYVAIAKTAHR